MLTVINNTSLKIIATVSTMDAAMTWAETVPYQNDFSIVAHTVEDLLPYSRKELGKLYVQLADWSLPENVSLGDLRDYIIKLLNEQEITSESPPDEKRVAPLTRNEDNDMAKKKATTKKAAVKKTATKKAAPKTERVKQNGVLLPKEGSKAGQCWAIADKLAKEAGAPPKRADVIEACVAAGLNKAGSSADFQAWRKFHGLTNAK